MDGILTVDESKEYVLHEYNCKRIKFQENEDSLAEFYLSEKRIDFEFMHYLELNENTYSSGK